MGLGAEAIDLTSGARRAAAAMRGGCLVSLRLRFRARFFPRNVRYGGQRVTYTLQGIYPF
jgi:hypothetical protein